jgi:diguanylate cyclase (GGDEF)-like protein/PAS domain S-box-containing protein
MQADSRLEVAAFVKRRSLPPEFNLERFFDYAIDMLCVADASGHFLKVNRAFERVMGYSREELLARPFVEFVHPDDRAETVAETSRLSTGMLCLRYENRYRAKDGSCKFISWTCYPDPETGLMYAVARDVTEEREREDRFDGITGIPNRRVFDETVTDETRRAQRMRQPVGLGLLDVDHLRAFNEAEGHLEGDRVLRRIAEVLLAHMRRAGDLVARYNGGTFGVLFPTLKSADLPRTHCDALRAGVEALDLAFTDTRGQARQLTLSGGFVVRIPELGDGPGALVQPAQDALTRAKAQGRNRVESA